MYEDVSARLVQEGKEGLYEDERLFISMVNRLNAQAFHIEEDAPDQRRQRKQEPVSMKKLASNQPESSAISTLRSIVEESEARKQGHVADPTDGTADASDLKRCSAEAESLSEPEAKRPKKP